MTRRHVRCESHAVRRWRRRGHDEKIGLKCVAAPPAEPEAHLLNSQVGREARDPHHIFALHVQILFSFEISHFPLSAPGLKSKPTPRNFCVSTSQTSAGTDFDGGSPDERRHHCSCVPSFVVRDVGSCREWRTCECFFRKKCLERLRKRKEINNNKSICFCIQGLSQGQD